jgi:hypothetical protein
MRRFLISIFLCALLAMASGISNGYKDVASAGTALPLSATSQTAVWLIVQANSGNAGDVYIGDSTVSSTTAPGIEPGDSIPFGRNEGFEDYNLRNLYVDCETGNTDGVTFIYFTRD